MRSNYAACLAITAKWEGGKVNDPDDPGGRTNKGVIQRTYDAYRRSKGLTIQSVYDMSESEYQEIFRVNYWNVVLGDDLPVGVDCNVFDGAINSGPAQSAKWIQRVVNVSTDGRIGSITLDAIINSCRTFNDTIRVIRAYGTARLSFLRNLSTFWKFGRGWQNRCADIEVESVRMAARDAGLTPDQIAAILAREGAAAGREAGQSAEAGRVSTGAGTATGGTTGAAGAATGDPVLWIVAGVIIIAVTVAFFVWRRRRNAQQILSDTYKTASAQEKQT